MWSKQLHLHKTLTDSSENPNKRNERWIYFQSFWGVFLLVKEINLLFPSVRNLPEITAENFSKVDLRQFKWIHWEVSEVWKSWSLKPRLPCEAAVSVTCFTRTRSRSSILRVLLQVWVPSQVFYMWRVWLYNLVIVWSAGPKRWRTGEDDPAGGGVQHLCAATTENNRFCGDRENQRAALPAVSTRWRGARLWADKQRSVWG